MLPLSYNYYQSFAFALRIPTKNESACLFQKITSLKTRTNSHNWSFKSQGLKTRDLFTIGYALWGRKIIILNLVVKSNACFLSLYSYYNETPEFQVYGRGISERLPPIVVYSVFRTHSPLVFGRISSTFSLSRIHRDSLQKEDKP